MSAPADSIELDEYALRALDRYLDARDAAHHATVLRDEAKAELVKSMGGATVGTVDGAAHVRVSRRQQWRMDVSAFKEAHERLYREYLREGAAYYIVTVLDETS